VLTVGNVPVADGKVRMVKVSRSAGMKPSISDTLSVPARTGAVSRMARSCCAAGVRPPISTSNVEAAVGVNVR